MSANMMRTHVVLPEDVVKTIDALVGRRARSRFLTEAAEEELRRVRQRAALEKVAGSLRNVDVPGWESPEAASEWVRQGRQSEDAQFEEGQHAC